MLTNIGGGNAELAARLNQRESEGENLLAFYQAFSGAVESLLDLGINKAIAPSPDGGSGRQALVPKNADSTNADRGADRSKGPGDSPLQTRQENSVENRREDRRTKEKLGPHEAEPGTTSRETEPESTKHAAQPTPQVATAENRARIASAIRLNTIQSIQAKQSKGMVAKSKPVAPQKTPGTDQLLRIEKNQVPKQKANLMVPFQDSAGAEGRIRLALRGHALYATIVSGNQETVDLLNSERSDIQRALLSRGFSQADVEVKQSMMNSDSGTGADGTDADEQRKRSDEGDTSQESNGDIEFLNILSEEEKAQ